MFIVKAQSLWDVAMMVINPSTNGFELAISTFMLSIVVFRYHGQIIKMPHISCL